MSQLNITVGSRSVQVIQLGTLSAAVNQQITQAVTASAASAAAAEGQAEQAASDANAALSSAQAASQQVTLAQQQVTLASAQVSLATIQSASASTSASAATTQAGIGAAANSIYPTTAAGVAVGTGVTSGKYFYVPSTNAQGSYDVWLNNSGTAVATGTTLPNLNAVIAIQNTSLSLSARSRRRGFSPAGTPLPLLFDSAGNVLQNLSLAGKIGSVPQKVNYRRGFGAYGSWVVVDSAYNIVLQPGVATLTPANAASLAGSLQRRDYSAYGVASLVGAFQTQELTGARISLAAIGDSRTQGGTINPSPAVTLYKYLARKCGYGGPGVIPLNTLTLGYWGLYFGTSGGSGWTQWNYLQGAAPYDGWENWLVKAGSYATSASGVFYFGLVSSVNVPAFVEFDTVRVHCVAVGGDCVIQGRPSTGFSAGGIAYTSLTVPASTVATPNHQILTITGFGKATGRYVLDLLPAIVGSGQLQVTTLEFINSAGGVSVHSIAIGGYKAGDHSGQNPASQQHFLSVLGIQGAYMWLGYNDSATPLATFQTNMQAIVNNVRAVSAVMPLRIVQGYASIEVGQASAISSLASTNDLVIMDARDPIPSFAYALAQGIMANDSFYPASPHLTAAGYEYVGHYFAKYLGLDMINQNLRTS